jgi:hypothetical protein
MSRSQLEHLHGDLIGASSLTTAEQRLRETGLLAG